MVDLKTLRIFPLLLSLAAMPLVGCGDDSEDDGSSGDGSSGDGDGDHDGHEGHTDDDATGDGDGDGHDGHEGHESGDGDGDTHDHVTCGLQENCTGDETLEADLTVDGEDGNFSVKVVSHNDLAPTMNDWTVQILDGDGNAVEGADVTASVWSVDCLHEGPTPPEELVSDADGHVDVAPVAAHGGPWNAVFAISKDGTEDTVEIALCIPGGAHGEMADAGMHDGHDGHDGHGE